MFSNSGQRPCRRADNHSPYATSGFYERPDASLLNTGQMSEQMERFTCGICFEIFDDEKHLPKSLRCGHTLCSMCLDKVLVKETQSLCPFCTIIIKKDILTTNFALLSLKDEYLTLKTEHLTLIKKLASFEKRFPEDFLKFEEENAAAAEKQKSVDSFIEVCDEYITTFDGITEDISSKLDLGKAVEKSNEVSQKIESLMFPSKMWHKLSDFENHKEFILQLHKKAKVAPVFAVHAIENRDFFGNVRFEGTKCYIYSMSTEEIDRRSKATFVPFQDLKLCWMETEFGAFLDISTIGGATVRPEIELGNNTLVSNFVILCTGEMGPSYKEAPCIQGGILEVPGYMSNGRLTTEPISLGPDISRGSKPYRVDNYYVEMRTDLSFFITKRTGSYCRFDTVGKVQNIPNFERLISFVYEAPKILDCGLVFHYI